MSFIRMKTVYRCKETGFTDTVFNTVLPRVLTVDRDYVARRFWTSNQTLFKEIEIVPPMEAATPAMVDVFRMKSNGRYSTAESLFSAIYRRLVDVILEQWTPGGIHALLHSSGIDSRVLSFIIRRLYQERGEDWLGHVLFICTDREASSFLEIMQYEGWPEECYAVVRPHRAEPIYYREQLRDYKANWERLNGVAALPVNIFWYPIEWAQKHGRLPDGPVQTWAGYWGNTVMDGGSSGGGPGICRVYEWFYNSHLCSRPIKGDRVVLPYTDIELASIVCQSALRLGKDLRFRFVEWLDPVLASFRNLDAQGDRQRPLDMAIRDCCQLDYDQSWYARHTRRRANIPAEVEFHAGWSYWSAGSLCNHLHEQGYELSVA